MNPKDAIRDAIIRYLYDRHSKARGPKAVAVKISDIQKEMKKSGYKQGETNSNLDYLIQKEWVREVVSQRTFTTPKGTTQQAESRTYKISDIGIDKLEEASVYSRPVPHPNINIVNVKGVTIIGDGNVVNTELTDLSRALKELEEGIIESPDFKDEEKLDIAADIGSLQSQISSPRPKKGLIQRIWQGIEKSVTLARFAGGLN
jgi:hypothetical protein